MRMSPNDAGHWRWANIKGKIGGLLSAKRRQDTGTHGGHKCRDAPCNSSQENGRESRSEGAPRHCGRLSGDHRRNGDQGAEKQAENSPAINRAAFSDRTIPAIATCENPRVRISDSSPRRSHTFRSSATASPTVPSNKPIPPNDWSVEK